MASQPTTAELLGGRSTLSSASDLFTKPPAYDDDPVMRVCRMPGSTTVAGVIDGEMFTGTESQYRELKAGERARQQLDIMDNIRSSVGGTLGYVVASAMWPGDLDRIEAGTTLGVVVGLGVGARYGAPPAKHLHTQPSGVGLTKPSAEAARLPATPLVSTAGASIDAAATSKTSSVRATNNSLTLSWSDPVRVDDLRSNGQLIPEKSGVYVFTNHPGPITDTPNGVLYVGKAGGEGMSSTLRTRIDTYLRSPDDLPVLSKTHPNQAASALKHAGKSLLMMQIQQDMRLGGQANVWVRWIETPDPSKLESDQIVRLQPAFNTAGTTRH